MNARELNGVLAGKIGSALDHFNDVVGDNPALCDWPGRDCNDQGSLAAARSELVEALAAYDALIADTRAGEGVEAVEAEAETPREALASRLIDVWCAEHDSKISWRKAVQIVAIITQVSDEERERLLAIGTEDEQPVSSDETVIATSDEILTRLANLYGTRAYEGEQFSMKHVGWRFSLSELRDFVAQIEVEVGHD